MPKKIGSEAGKILQSLRKTRGGGRPPVMYLCAYCNKEWKAGEIRVHMANCPKRKKKAAK